MEIIFENLLILIVTGFGIYLTHYFKTYNIKHSFIYEGKYKSIIKLYKLLAETETEFRYLTTHLTHDNEPINRNQKEATIMFNKLQKYYYCIDIYFDEKLCIKIKKVINSFLEALSLFETSLPSNPNKKRDVEYWTKAQNKIFKDIVILQKELKIILQKELKN